jgi:phosphate starvation-inducible protein PhoH and related proteins
MMKKMPMPNTLFYGLNLTEEQKEYADSIFDNQLTITDSISGSGKTTIAVGVAKLLQKPLYYFFAPIGEDIFGFLPGDLEDKTNKYLLPLTDALTEIGETPEKVIFSEKDHRPHAWVHATSHAFWRGGNLKDCVVLIDESQNVSKHDLKKILTRCHKTTKIIMIGHMGQMDVPPEQSGFLDYINHAKGRHFAKQVDLTFDFRGELARWADQI